MEIDFLSGFPTSMLQEEIALVLDANQKYPVAVSMNVVFITPGLEPLPSLKLPDLEPKPSLKLPNR